jgi:hypothetical protein
MLVDTLLIPRLILPYLNCCVIHASILNKRCDDYGNILEGGADKAIAEMALESPNLVKGMAASIRTLIISSFRAPATQYVMSLLRRLNPTASILKASSFVIKHDYIFSLLCLLNINMGALDLSKGNSSENVVDAYRAHALLYEMAAVYSSMDKNLQTSIYKRVMAAGALPVSRDTPSYTAVMSVLHGGAAGQLEYVGKNELDSIEFTLINCMRVGSVAGAESKGDGDDEDHWDSRAEAKRAHADRMVLHFLTRFIRN